MNFNQTILILSKHLIKKQPKTFTGLWVKINVPNVYRFIKKNIKTPIGQTDWDKVISSLDRSLQKRWMGETGKRRRKPIKKYKDKTELDLVLKQYNKKLYIFISPLDRADYYLCDIISIVLVRLAQKGNILAKEKVEELVGFVINRWMEHNPFIIRWRGYNDKVSYQLNCCIRRFRYAGTFLGYLFRTLERAGAGLRPLRAYSLDDTFADSKKRKVDNVIKDLEMGEIRMV